jgi:hypothetical protein
MEAEGMSLGTLPRDATVLRAPAELLCQELDGEFLVVHPESQRGYCLNGVGARIWQLLQQPITVAALVEQLSTEFDVDAGACENEVCDFLRQLRSADLISIDPRQDPSQWPAPPSSAHSL